MAPRGCFCLQIPGSLFSVSRFLAVCFLFLDTCTQWVYCYLQTLSVAPRGCFCLQIPGSLFSVSRFLAVCFLFLDACTEWVYCYLQTLSVARRVTSSYRFLAVCFLCLDACTQCVYLPCRPWVWLDVSARRVRVWLPSARRRFTHRWNWRGRRRTGEIHSVC